MKSQTQRKWTREEIRHNLLTDNKWLYRGLLAIYKRQTDDEKESESTRHNNNVGFSGADSVSLTRYTKEVQKLGGIWSIKGLAMCRRKMLKYAGQLAKIANGEIL